MYGRLLFHYIFKSGLNEIYKVLSDGECKVLIIQKNMRNRFLDCGIICEMNFKRSKNNP